jgi:hypothetical protein
MKVIFLDVDGVLNNVADINRGVELEDSKLALYSHIVKSTDAITVLSSSWRLSANDFDEVESALLFYDVKIHDVTPTLPRYMYGTPASRASEVQKWIDINHPEKFVVIDDVDDSLHIFGDKFVKTDFSEGLTDEIANKVIGILT